MNRKSHLNDISQDSNLRSMQKWLFTCYDALNRADSTGVMTDPTHYSSLSFHTNAALQSPTYPNLSGYTVELLTRNFYDDYKWVAPTSAPVLSTFDASHSGPLRPMGMATTICSG
jgi:hypothetical protein